MKAFPPLANLNAANLLTSASVACGFLATLALAAAHIPLAVTLLGAATLLDRLDGVVARRTGTSSPFGGELDSLADAISFGVAPAWLAYALGVDHPLLLPLLVLYVLAAVWRLAHYNLVGLDGGAFSGVPTTIVASWMLVVCPVALLLPAPGRVALMSGYLAVGAVLMTCGLRYPKDARSTRALFVLVPAAVVACWGIIGAG